MVHPILTSDRKSYGRVTDTQMVKKKEGRRGLLNCVRFWIFTPLDFVFRDFLRTMKTEFLVLSIDDSSLTFKTVKKTEEVESTG